MSGPRVLPIAVLLGSAALLACGWERPTGAQDVVTNPAVHGTPITALALVPGAAEAVSGSADGAVVRWALDRIPPERRFVTSLGGAVLGVAAAPDGSVLALADDGTVYRVGTADDVTLLARHPEGALALAVSADGGTLATAGVDGHIRTWACADGTPGRELRGHEGPVAALAFAGDRLLSAGWDGSVRGWDARRGRPRGSFALGSRELTAIAIDPAGETAAATSFDGTITIIDLARGESMPLPSRPHGEWVRSVAFSPSGRLLVAAAPAEGALIVAEVLRPERARSLADDGSPSVAIFLDEETCLVGRFDGTVGRLAVGGEEGGR